MKLHVGMVLACMPLLAAGEGIAEADSLVFGESGGERQVLRFNDLGGSLGMAPPADHGGFAVNRDLIRGFPNESALRNGVRDFGYLGLESLAAREGVEVFKGPASALYGNGKPGGDINLLARQPDGVRRRDVQWSVSRYGMHSVRADLGTAVGDTVAFRLGAGADWGPGRRQFDDMEGYGLSPSISWRLSPDTRITVEADVVKARDQVQPDRIAQAPLLALSDRRTLGEPGDVARESGTTWRLAIEHAFDARWRLRQGLFVQRSRWTRDATELDVYGMTGNSVLTDDGRSVRRVSAHRSERIAGEVSQTELHGRVDWAGASHQLLAGLELGRYRVDATGRRAPLAALNLDAPVYGALPGSFVSDADQAMRSRTTVLYLQDRLAFGERWQLLLGLRGERIDASNDDRLGGALYTGRSSLVSPRLGLVYAATPSLSWFASWTQSSRPQLGASTADGSLLPPEQGRQLEAGLQWGHPKDGLLGTLSVYQLRKRGLATTDVRNPAFSVAGGERESRGVELELRGELARGLSLDLSAELLEAKVLKDSAVPAGTALPGVPRWFASAWLTQRLDERWTLGLGLVAEGRRRAAWPPNELRLPAYATMDLSLAYRGDGWRVQVGAGNVFGRRAMVSDGYAVRFIEPRSLTVTLSTAL
ncbi:hypothetical protein C7T35_34095 [Variovorax sp. WS11]|uniref:TonB-dependent siderophore receptor n=1 Tax=Variovorax sp. WS11 TaxID=1105204 RepID=UPI000D0DD3E1|nr:TonB-dependent receptor [Variovorax sp. WS11]NDZ18041.1 TonB-dependent receptor [Variovorax sp. WS11]PSL80078.1 hypothetical protein C7T35_34095 [Variovorax sp. WS11]